MSTSPELHAVTPFLLMGCVSAALADDIERSLLGRRRLKPLEVLGRGLLSQWPVNHSSRPRRVGFHYVHVAVDDHSRLAFARILPDEKGATCAAFLADAAVFFADHGIRIRSVMTDNAMNYRLSGDFRAALDTLGATHLLTRPHSPWQNGKAERFNRTLQEGWAYRHPFHPNQARADALDPWLDHYNYARPHTACGGQPPISRTSPTK